MAEVMSMGEIEAFQNKHKVDLDSSIQLGNEHSSVIRSEFGNVIVVDNLPVVAADKYDKLENCLWMPVDPETKTSLGYYERAMHRNNKKRLDNSHILAVNSIDDFDRFMKLSADEWVSPEIKPYTPWENLQQWLTDVNARDQFFIRAGNDTEWSSYGTYLATLNGQGVDVWGGASTFVHLSSCAHPQVKLIDFSPGEKYLVTYISHEPNSPREIHRIILNISDVKTGKVVHGFEGSADEFTLGGVSRFSWPFLRWGGGKDDKYFARIGKNFISKSLRVENVLDFAWSPVNPIIALFVPELDGGNQPAKVTLVQIPGKEELRQKNLFGVI
ncbi:hypothetical protein MKW92_016177 [Papaver armeniacum]|nr:hypothetical protein MKW92_016177 [Papaver armeniacum]